MGIDGYRWVVFLLLSRSDVDCYRSSVTEGQVISYDQTSAALTVPYGGQVVVSQPPPPTVTASSSTGSSGRVRKQLVVLGEESVAQITRSAGVQLYKVRDYLI